MSGLYCVADTLSATYLPQVSATL